MDKGHVVVPAPRIGLRVGEGLVGARTGFSFIVQQEAKKKGGRKQGAQKVEAEREGDGGQDNRVERR
jgi:hypothetical protein